jgi:hypothetical protein
MKMFNELIRNSRDIAQAVSCWFLIPAALVRAQSVHVGFVVEKVALGQVFTGHFGFPCLIIPPNSPSS